MQAIHHFKSSKERREEREKFRYGFRERRMGGDIRDFYLFSPIGCLVFSFEVFWDGRGIWEGVLGWNGRSNAF